MGFLHCYLCFIARVVFYRSNHCVGRPLCSPRNFFLCVSCCQWLRWSFGAVASFLPGRFLVFVRRGFGGRRGLTEWPFVFYCFVKRFWFLYSMANKLDFTSPKERINPPSTDVSSTSTPQNSYQIFLAWPSCTSGSLDTAATM